MHAAKSRLCLAKLLRPIAFAILFLLGVSSVVISGPRLTQEGAPEAGNVRGIVRAVQQASISTQLATPLAELHFKEGEAFKSGDRIAVFDCRKQRAGLAAAEAQQLEMQHTLDKFVLLLQARSVGRNDMQVAQARVAKAKAEVDGLRSQLDQCVLIAPFSGRVLELGLQRFETAQPGKPYITISAMGKLEVDLLVPSNWARWLKPGVSFLFFIDEVQREVKATVVRIGAAVDPISQTMNLVGKFETEIADVLPGMSGTARFSEQGD